MSYKHYSRGIDTLVDECVTFRLILKHLGFKTCPKFVHSSKRGKANENQQYNHQ